MSNQHQSSDSSKKSSTPMLTIETGSRSPTQVIPRQPKSINQGSQGTQLNTILTRRGERIRIKQPPSQMDYAIINQMAWPISRQPISDIKMILECN